MTNFDNLNIANKEADHQLHCLKDEIARLKTINGGKAGEITDLSESVKLRDADNANLRSQIQDVERIIGVECAEGTKLRVDITKTNDNIDKLNADIHVTDNCISSRHQDIDGLNGNINKRMIDIDDKNKDIGITNAEIHRINDNISKAKADQERLKGRLGDEIDEHHRLRKDQGIF